MNYDIKIKNKKCDHKKSITGTEITYVSITEAKIQSQLKERNNHNLFSKLFGRWPGEELWQEVIDDLD